MGKHGNMVNTVNCINVIKLGKYRISVELVSLSGAVSAALPAAVGGSSYRRNYFFFSGGKICQAMPWQEAPGTGHCPERRLEMTGEEVWPL